MTHIEPLLQLQAKHNIITQSYAALTPVHRHPTGGPLKPYLTKLAEQLSKESGQEIDEAGVLILWVVCKGEVCVTSSNKEERIKSMAATEKVRDLTKEEIAEIDRLGNQVHFRHWVRLHYAREIMRIANHQDLDRAHDHRHALAQPPPGRVVWKTIHLYAWRRSKYTHSRH